MTPAGRPKLPPEQRRTRSLQLYLSDEELAKVEELAAKCGLKVAEYVRRRALGRRTK